MGAESADLTIPACWLNCSGPGSLLDWVPSNYAFTKPRASAQSERTLGETRAIRKEGGAARSRFLLVTALPPAIGHEYNGLEAESDAEGGSSETRTKVGGRALTATPPANHLL